MLARAHRRPTGAPRCRRRPRPAPSSRCAAGTGSARSRASTGADPAAAASGRRRSPGGCRKAISRRRRRAAPRRGRRWATGPSRCATARCSSSLYSTGRADLRGGRPGRRRPRPRRPGAASVRLLGKGSKERVVPGRAVRASRRVEAYLVRARPGAGRRRPGDARGVPQHARGAAEPAERVGGAAARGRARRAGRRRARLPAHPAALVRDPPARRRRRRPGRPGAARARLGDDDADLHAWSRRTRCARSTRPPTRGRSAERQRARRCCRAASGARACCGSLSGRVASQQTTDPQPRRRRAAAARRSPSPAPLAVARPGAHHRDVQPEGRRRQDDDDHQPGRRARRVRPQGARRRLRPAGRRVGRPRASTRTSWTARSTTCSWSADADDRTTSSSATGVAGPRPAARRTSTCPPPRCSWSARSPASRCWPARCGPVLDDYDVILIDCQPSLGLLTVNALTAAHGVLIPLECEFFALRGVALLVETIEKVRDRLNPRLEVDGILATMYDPRTLHAREVVARVQRGLRRHAAAHRDRADGEVPRRHRWPPSRSRPTRRPTRVRRPTASWPVSSSPVATPPDDARSRPGAAAAGAAARPSARRRSRSTSTNFTGPVRPAARPDRQAPARHHRGRARAGHRRVHRAHPGRRAAAASDRGTSARPSEFLVVAATLLDLKAARLLPVRATSRTPRTSSCSRRATCSSPGCCSTARTRTSPRDLGAAARRPRRGACPRPVALEPHLAALLPELVLADRARASSPRSRRKALAPKAAAARRRHQPPARPGGQRPRAGRGARRPAAARRARRRSAR